MNLNDKIWLLLNKSSQSRVVSYLNIVFPWFAVGLGVGYLFPATLRGREGPIPWILAFIVLGVVLFLLDRKGGYLDAIHQNYLKRREERLKKIEGK